MILPYFWIPKIILISASGGTMFIMICGSGRDI